MKYIFLILVFISTNVYAQKVTALTEDTSPTVDDLTITVDNPSGTPVTKKATIANIFKSHNLYTNSGANVGIGTAIPTVEAAYRGLEIKAPTNAGATISLDTTDADRNPQIEFVENNVQKWKVFNENVSDSLRFRTGATDVITLTSAGNVGIGTDTPQAGFVVTNGNVGIGTWVARERLTLFGGDYLGWTWGTGASTVYQRIGHDNSGYALKYSSTGGDTDENPMHQFLTNKGGGSATAVMTILRGGNLGIGTSTPQGALTIMSGNVGIGTWIPNSSIYINGSAAFKMVQTTTTYAVLATDYTVECTSGTFTVTLETAVGATGRIHQIKNSGSGTITIATTSSQTIDGQASGTITLAQYDSITVQSNGSNWIIL